MATLYLDGFIRDATYTPHLNPEKFETYNIMQFDVNQAQASGLIDLGTSGNNLGLFKMGFAETDALLPLRSDL